jgi:hypothetical protein
VDNKCQPLIIKEPLKKAAVKTPIFRISTSKLKEGQSKNLREQFFSFHNLKSIQNKDELIFSIHNKREI